RYLISGADPADARRKLLKRDIVLREASALLMGDEKQLPPEHGIVSARMRGAMSIDGSFERLYRMYAPVVIGWLTLRVEPHAVDDLLQDVWTVFYGRWRSWQQPAELDTPEARPVLSFLFRTVPLATRGHRRSRIRALPGLCENALQ